MVATIAALAVVLGGAAAPVKVTLTAPGHTPKVKVHWNYTVRATRGGKPVAARLTAVMIDPLGGKHPVTYGTTSREISNWPFKGAFRDFILFPASGRGIPLTFEVTVAVGRVKRTIDYKVT